MTGKTHLATGIAIGLAGTLFLKYSGIELSIPETYTLVSVAGIGGLVPDIDIPTSKIGSKIKPISAVIKVVFGHRTLTHSPLLYILLGMLFATIPEIKLYGIVFCISAVSHLLLDALNKKGIPLFFPFSRKTVRILGVSSNGIIDKLLCIGFIIFDILLLLNLIGG